MGCSSYRMGGCIGITRTRSGAIDDSGSVSRPNSGMSTSLPNFNQSLPHFIKLSGSTRKNHPLCHETIRWKSDVPLTEGQLRSKRDEFWDTAPAFDGRKEIWDALRAAAVAAEALDFELAQAILDGANISVPNGYLTECYDELGTRYLVPIYCLSYPINIVKEDSGRDSPADCSEPADGGVEVVLKLRLSHTCNDVKLGVFSTDTIGMCKKKLHVSINCMFESMKGRLFYVQTFGLYKMCTFDCTIKKRLF